MVSDRLEEFRYNTLVCVFIHVEYCLIVLIASVDIDRVVREMDFQTLQQNIFNVAFCNIDAEVNMNTVYYCLSYYSLYRSSGHWTLTL